MNKAQTTFDAIPSSAISTIDLEICLKCAFDFFINEQELAPRAAYLELRKHVPEEADFTGAATQRPHFFESETNGRCPYCKAPKTWMSTFHAYRIEAHPAFEAERKEIWANLEKHPDRYVIWRSPKTGQQILSEWLEGLRRRMDDEGDKWPEIVAQEYLDRRGFALASKSGEPYTPTPIQQAEILLVQFLASRSHMGGPRTSEGKLSTQQVIDRLKALGYYAAKKIVEGEMYEEFEQAVVALVASNSDGVYYVVDRGDYLKHLKTAFDQKYGKKLAAK